MKFDTQVQQDMFSSRNAKLEVLDKNKMAAAATMITPKMVITRLNIDRF